MHRTGYDNDNWGGGWRLMTPGPCSNTFIKKLDNFSGSLGFLALFKGNTPSCIGNNFKGGPNSHSRPNFSFKRFSGCDLMEGYGFKFLRLSKPFWVAGIPLIRVVRCGVLSIVTTVYPL